MPPSSCWARLGMQWADIVVVVDVDIVTRAA
jgi:hypothetical protein